MAHAPRANGCRRLVMDNLPTDRFRAKAALFCVRGLLVCLLAFAAGSAGAQGMMGHVDLGAPEFIEAELTREAVAKLLADGARGPADL